MTEEQVRHAAEGKRTMPVVAIAVIALLAIIVGAVVFWLITRDTDAAPTPSPSPSESPSVTPSPSQTPSPSRTPTVSDSPSPAPVDEASLTDANGRWCPTSPPDWEQVCITVNLPEVRYDDAPSLILYFAPPGAGLSTDPETWDFSGAPNTGGCWVSSIDTYMGDSGSPALYCPAGADVDEHWAGMAGPSDVDRLWPSTQDPGDYPYVRAD